MATGRAGARLGLRRRLAASPVNRREVLLLVVLPPLMVFTGIEVVQLLSDAYTDRPYGLSYHLFYSVGSFVGFTPDQLAAFGAFSTLGLFVLTTLDEYKRIHGMVLLGLSAVSVLVLSQRGVLIPNVDWAAQVLPAAGGLVFGVFVGGLKRDTNGFYHDAFRSKRGTTWREFDKALYRVFYLVFVLVVLALIEEILVYDSPVVWYEGTVVLQSFEMRAVDPAGVGPHLLAAVGFLASIYVYRSNTAEKEVMVMGASGTGKSTMMAGLALSAPEYSGSGSVYANEPLQTLRRKLRQKGFDAFPTTPPGYVVPLELTYKHGFLFPRKVTIRTFDYAGDYIDGLSPRTEASETVTQSTEEAMEVAAFILNTAGSGGTREDNELAAINWYGERENVGKNPDEVDGLEGLGDAERVTELIKDMAYYADSVGLIYPLEDYAQPAVTDGTIPPHVELDEDNEIVRTRDRTSDYERVFDRIAGAYDGKDVFYLATFADYVANDFDTAAATGVTHRSNWYRFAQHICDRFLDGALPEGSDCDLIPVYFPIADDEPPEDDEKLEVDLDVPGELLPLHGAEPLLDRMGE